MMSGTSKAEDDLGDVMLGQGIVFVVLARFHRNSNYPFEAVLGGNFSCHPHDEAQYLSSSDGDWEVASHS